MRLTSRAHLLVAGAGPGLVLYGLELGLERRRPLAVASVVLGLALLPLSVLATLTAPWDDLVDR